MSEELIQQFIDDMRSAGIGPAMPSVIRADNQRRDYQLDSDPKNLKKGFYKLKVDGNFGVGFYGDYRQGDYKSWTSKVPGKYTAQQREEWRKRIEAEKAQEAAERLAMHQEKAREAQDFLLFLEPAINHPYLTAKGIKPYSALISGENLIIPMGDAIQVWNYQSIDPSGKNKLFVTKARKQGTWHEIPGDDIICIVEGFATGCSVREATGHTVICAMDAGNLPAIAPAVRAKYPDNKIIFCADNDRFTSGNQGITKATIAANLINGLICYPQFPDNAEKKHTDYNDLHELSGILSVKNSIQQASKPHVEEAPAAGVNEVSSVDIRDSQASGGGDLTINPDWQSLLTLNKNEQPVPTSLHNTIIILENDPIYRGIFRYNEFKSEIFICRCPPWEEDHKFKVRRIENIDLTRCEAFLESHSSMRPGPTRTLSAIEASADRDRFHPVREYFSELQWDNVPRLVTWLKKYAHADNQPEEYLSKVGTAWLVSAVARIFKPGCKSDHMLVLEGPQDFGKSMLLRIMGTFGRDVEETYYTDAINIGNIEERGSILKLQGNLIIEFPELAGLGKKDQNELKRWITLQSDEVEVKHKQRTQLLPRQFILAGTYNPIAGMGWLNDPTGGRRFWPVGVGKKILLKELKSDREQLWAEAVHKYKEGYQLYVDDNDPVYSMMKKEQADRADFDLWHEEVVKICAEREEWTASEILTTLGIPVAKQNNRTDKGRVNKILNQMGWQYKNRMIAGVQKKCWCPPKPQQIKLVYQEPEQNSDSEGDIKWG